MRSMLTVALALVAALIAAPAASARTPILVVDSAANPYSGYVKEIMRAEGLNGFDSATVGSLTAAQIAPYDVVVLGDVAVTPTQASALTTWVNGGGNLVALSPDPNLNALLGLTAPIGTRANAYLKVNTAQAPGAGIVGETIQYHGSADLYALTGGATAVATLYSDASTPTSNPAVSLRSVGSGEAAAFTFDVARSVSLTRQGNPAWAGVDSDDAGTVAETSDLFWGHDGAPNWVDTDKLDIPQADELQRLFANVITYVNRDRTPVPRFWYLPSGHSAAVVMTGDDHNEGGTGARFEQYKAASPAGCSVVLWQCVRSTSYIIADPNLDSPFPASQANAYTAEGFEVAVHPWRGNCTTPDETAFNTAYTTQLNTFAARYPNVPAPTTSRFHCIPWPDWSTHAKVEINHGIRLDTNYYHFPFLWGGEHPGYMTGSAEIMRFADSDGTTLPLYQANTHLTDEGLLTPELTETAIDGLLEAATGPQGYYGLLTANMHTDFPVSEGSDTIIASAQAHGVPVISARQALNWVEGRDASSFSSVTWSAGRLGFTVAAGANTTGMQGMVPMQSSAGRLLGVSRNGVALPVTVRTIKGVEYGFFSALSGRYEARYPGPVVSPGTGGGGTGSGGGTGTTPDTKAPRVRVTAPRQRSLRGLLRSGVAFWVTSSEAGRVTARLTMRIDGRDVSLARVTRTLRADRGRRLVVKLSKSAARRLRRSDVTRVKLVISAKDAAGNTRALTRRIRVSR